MGMEMQTEMPIQIMKEMLKETNWDLDLMI
jgi:hypothetical protein